jgi:myb proto-oncogene protein
MEDRPPAILFNPDHPTRNRSHQNKAKDARWSPEEDAILTMKITDPDNINWMAIYPLLPGKTAKQVIERWTRVLDPRLKKGSWTAAEDRILMDFVALHGSLNWTDCAKLLPGRIGKQCRERWCNFLSPDLIREPFTEAEDAQLVALHARLGNNWQQISNRMAGRAANCLKNRWHLLVRKQRHIPTGKYTEQENSPPEKSKKKNV